MRQVVGWIVVAAAGLAARPAPAQEKPPQARPNILWLVGEDFGPELGCYGTKEVSSPNLDKLAARGVRFTRAYSTAPVCSASRSAFMTGMYQTTIGAHNHRSHRDDGYKLPAGVRPIAERMHDAGYFTANVRQFPPEVGFNGTGKTDWNFTHAGPDFDTDRWADLKPRQPFFAQVNFSETHRDFHAPAHADPARVEVPPYYPDHPVVRADWAQYLDAATELDRKVGRVLDQFERDGLADTTAVVFMGDHGQAHVRGKQFCYEEGLHIPLIVAWPKGFPAPAGLEPGRVDARLVEAIDLAPTFLDWAGVAPPPQMQGHILFGDRKAPDRLYAFGARDRCDETVFRFRTVRDGRYRLIRNFTPDRPFLQANAYKEKSYPVWNLLKELDAQGKLDPVQKVLTAPTMPAEEFYDLDADPHEIKNLANSADPAHREALDRLRAALADWIERTDDQGRTPEPPAVAAARGATRPGTNPDGGPSPKAKRKRRPPPPGPTDSGPRPGQGSPQSLPPPSIQARVRSDT